MGVRTYIAAIVIVLIAITSLSYCSVSDAEEIQYPSYVGPDGSVYHYETHGSGSPSSPYYSTIRGYDQGDNDSTRIQSALEGYPVTVIADNAFSGTMGCVVVPERITSIGNGAFLDCRELTDVYFLGDLPDELASDAFSDYVVFHYIEGKSGWSSYSDHRIEPIKSAVITSTDGSVTKHILTGSDVIVIEGTPNDSGQVTIPFSVTISGVQYDVTSLGAWLFYDRSDVKEVMIESGIDEISERAFYKCASLENVDIPDTVTVIMDEAFRECDLLNNVTMTNTTFIGFEAFRMCYAFTSITVPDTVTFIGEGAFRYCTSATSIVLSNNIDEITPWMLDGCYLLESIIIPENISSIGNYGFHLCKTLTTVTIPCNVDSIGNNAFYGCTSLTDAYFEGSMPDMGKDVFKNVSDDFEIHQNNNDNNNNDVNTIVIVLIIVILLLIAAISYFYFKSRRNK